MVTATGQVKLTDFGIAVAVGGTRLTGSDVIGTPAYMAPEQLQGLAITPAVDLWALGVTITGGPVNSVVGAVSYPNIGCTYDVRLISAQPDQVTLYEQVKSGLCESEYVVLAPAGGGITENVYAGPPSGGRPDFAGPLSRAS